MTYCEKFPGFWVRAKDGLYDAGASRRRQGLPGRGRRDATGEVVMTGTGWNDDVQGEPAAQNGQEHLAPTGGGNGI